MTYEQEAPELVSVEYEDEQLFVGTYDECIEFLRPRLYCLDADEVQLISQTTKRELSWLI